ncbi:cellulase family glycosylhydrolase [bacterium]|nr:cellulase family glycosylhydrolase [bacterium]
MKRNPYPFVLMILMLSLFCTKSQPSGPGNDQTDPEIPALRTEGHWIKNTADSTVILRGVNIASLEWTDKGENVVQSVRVAADQWKANLVRIPLSQDRWFGKAPTQSDSGILYRRIVDDVVEMAKEKGIYVLLELHWNNAGQWGRFIGQHKMPDRNSVIFWKDIAAVYANVSHVLFGLYNEPHDVSWDIWLNGGDVTENLEVNGENQPVTYEAVGHQALLDSVRSAGATKNLVVIGGLDWGYDLSGILTGYAVTGANIIYDTHCYPWKSRDWDGKFGNVGRQTVILVGEWGGDFNEGHKDYGLDLAQYLRDNKFCWTAWCFHPSAGPCLIRDWTYEPTGFGRLVLRELLTPAEADTAEQL